MKAYLITTCILWLVSGCYVSTKLTKGPSTVNFIGQWVAAMFYIVLLLWGVILLIGMRST
jgi:hypothetical protein